MRRDVLELDAAISRHLHPARLRLEDVESIRLILSGGSVIDWQQAAFTDLASVDRFLALHLFDPNDPLDHARLHYLYNEAVSYAEEHLHFRLPEKLRTPPDLRHVFLWASDTTGFRRTQMLSCVILKLMHVINHLEAADLKLHTPISEVRLHELANRRVQQTAEEMRASGVPLVAFYGSRKTRTSIISKLLAKRDNLAATLFDKLRYRVVVPTADDLAPALTWLVQNMFPFNYVIPGQSHNNLLDPTVLVSYLAEGAHSGSLRPLVDMPVQDSAAKNEFSGASYRMINFIVDFPVRLPARAGAVPGFGFELGRTVFVMVELQLVDEATALDNEAGENAHHLYKARQQETMDRRLKRGLFG